MSRAPRRAERRVGARRARVNVPSRLADAASCDAASHANPGADGAARPPPAPRRTHTPTKSRRVPGLHVVREESDAGEGATTAAPTADAPRRPLEAGSEMASGAPHGVDERATDRYDGARERDDKNGPGTAGAALVDYSPRNWRECFDERRRAPPGFCVYTVGDLSSICHGGGDADRAKSGVSAAPSATTGDDMGVAVPSSTSSLSSSACSSFPSSSPPPVPPPSPPSPAHDHRAVAADTASCSSSASAVAPTRAVHPESTPPSTSPTPVLLLLHGGGHTALSWALTVRNLRARIAPRDLRIVAYDARAHGGTRVQPETQLDAHTLVDDACRVLAALFPADGGDHADSASMSGRVDVEHDHNKAAQHQTTACDRADAPDADAGVQGGRDLRGVPPLIIAGHSMGGATAVWLAASARIPRLLGLVVIDIVEGSALPALPHMQRWLASRRQRFASRADAVRYVVHAGHVRNVESARYSVPPQVTKREEVSTDETIVEGSEGVTGEGKEGEAEENEEEEEEEEEEDGQEREQEEQVEKETDKQADANDDDRIHNDDRAGDDGNFGDRRDRHNAQNANTRRKSSATLFTMPATPVDGAFADTRRGSHDCRVRHERTPVAMSTLPETTATATTATASRARTKPTNATPAGASHDLSPPSASRSSLPPPASTARVQTRGARARYRPYTWRTPLASTEQHWRTWFNGMSRAFVAVAAPKLLILATHDRLDRELMIAQMQGKFQTVLAPHAGHSVHEDAPESVAEAVAAFVQRHRMVPADGQAGLCQAPATRQ